MLSTTENQSSTSPYEQSEVGQRPATARL